MQAGGPARVLQCIIVVVVVKAIALLFQRKLVHEKVVESDPHFRLMFGGQHGPQNTINMASINTSHALKQFDDLVARGELFYTPSKPVIIDDNGLDVSMISPAP